MVDSSLVFAAVYAVAASDGTGVGALGCPSAAEALRRLGVRVPAGIEIITEEDTRGGWEYHARIAAGGEAREVRVKLAWVDHDHWSGGRCAPSLVIERLLGLLVSRVSVSELPEHFNAASARRWAPEIDALMVDAFGGRA